MKPRTCVGAGTLVVTLAVLLGTLPGCIQSSIEEYVPIPYPSHGTDGTADDSAIADADSASGGESASESPGAGGQAGDQDDGNTPPTDGVGNNDGDGNAARVTVSIDGDAGGEAAQTEQDDAAPGTLTAGSFDDNLNFDVFQWFLSYVLQADVAGVLPNLPLGQRIIVCVENEHGDPVHDARVVISPGSPDQAQDNPAVLDQTTGSDGRVLFLTGLDDGSNAKSYTLTVHPPDGSSPVVEVRDLKNLQWSITLAADGSSPSRLDLAFVVDTTSSMADELEYLKAEARSVAERVNELFPDVQQRFALIVYRDQGDAYVLRSFDFTRSLATFEGNLSAQRAEGGYDWREAMHLALEEALELSWATTDTARVVFLIADAPPHVESAQRTMDAIQALRAQAIAVYPVAASGVSTELEFFMRTAAFLTLGQYLFLTDDSGVGDAQVETDIPCYHVQRLDQLMTRMIRTELSGRRIEADADEIICTVGNPVNGVCREVLTEEEAGQ